MTRFPELPLPKLDALRLGAHRLFAVSDESLCAAIGVRVAFTGREGGVSEGVYSSLNCGMGTDDDAGAIRRNLEIVREAIGAVSAPFIVPNQVHGTDIVSIDSLNSIDQASRRVAVGADAVVVECAGVSAFVAIADCLPLAIVSPSGRFAVVHAGWRGAVGHIARKVAQCMADGDDCSSERYNAYIGPHIQAECFEVGPDVAARFVAEFGSRVLRDDRHVSLTEAVTSDLVRAGLPAERIASFNDCTKCHPDRYFSYRATGGCCGRNAVVAYRSQMKGL